MAPVDSSTASRASLFPIPTDLSGIRFVLDAESFCCLLDILSAYDDLAELMDSGCPEFRFLEMLNFRFAHFVQDIPSVND